jgi:hypothetical protein
LASAVPIKGPSLSGIRISRNHRPQPRCHLGAGTLKIVLFATSSRQAAEITPSDRPAFCIHAERNSGCPIVPTATEHISHFFADSVVLPPHLSSKFLRLPSQQYTWLFPALEWTSSAIGGR